VSEDHDKHAIELEVEVARLGLEVASLEEKLTQLSGVATTIGFVIATCLAKSDATFPGKVAEELDGILRAVRANRPKQADDFSIRTLVRLVEDLRMAAEESEKPVKPRQAAARPKRSTAARPKRSRKAAPAPRKR
jgi:hypothetical protein